MFVTKALCNVDTAKKVLISIKSVVSPHTRLYIKLKSEDKVEKLMYDPIIRQESVYTEYKKIRSLK